MKLGLISDTHGHVPFTVAALRILFEQGVDAILHSGDIGSPAIVPLFLGTPTSFVFGNVDYDTQALRNSIAEHQFTCCDRFGELPLEEVNIALLHGDDSLRLEQAIHGGDYQLVIHGHTHERRLEWFADTLVVNPGAVYRANPRSVATINLPDRTVQHFDIAPSTN
ncbi:MAG: YfcE family phosphodiesterase [Planctomycetaceae bacterium]